MDTPSHEAAQSQGGCQFGSLARATPPVSQAHTCTKANT